MAKGYCNAHYQQVRRDEYPSPIRRRQKPGALCWCGKPAHRIDLCREHFNEFQRKPRPDGPRKGRPVPVYTICPVRRCEGKVTSKSIVCSKHRIWSWKYGIPQSAIAEMLENAQCSNQACNATNDLVMDHDHSCCRGNTKTCGKCNRGFLCRRCNTALGMLQDNPELIRGLLVHLGQKPHQDAIV